MRDLGVHEAISFCRICGGGCGVRLTIDENDRICRIQGDHDQPMSKGYMCFKGLQAEDAHHGPARLLHPLKRMPDGSFKQIALETALDEIADLAEGIAVIAAERLQQRAAVAVGNLLDPLQQFLQPAAGGLARIYGRTLQPGRGGAFPPVGG